LQQIELKWAKSVLFYEELYRTVWFSSPKKVLWIEFGLYLKYFKITTM